MLGNCLLIGKDTMNDMAVCNGGCRTRLQVVSLSIPAVVTADLRLNTPR